MAVDLNAVERQGEAVKPHRVLKALELLAETDDPNLETMRNIRAKIRDGLDILETPKLSRKGKLKGTCVRG